MFHCMQGGHVEKPEWWVPVRGPVDWFKGIASILPFARPPEKLRQFWLVELGGC